jgi:hypothetical protein
MGGGAALAKPIKIAQSIGIIKKSTAPVAKPQPVSPTTAEVSQSEATAADGMGAMSRKAKRKGRSATILTSSTGVDESVTLGTKSLLGG